MFYHFIGSKHFPEYFFNYVRFYVIVHQKIDLKRVHTDVPFIESPRPLFVEQTRKNYHKIVWIAEIAASQIVADRKGNALIADKMIKKLLCFLLLSLLFKHFCITKH